MHLICATHAHTLAVLHIIYTSKYFDSALFDWWMRTALLWQAICVCVWVKTKINGLVYSQSPSPSLSLSLSALRLHSNRMPQSSREAAAACAAEGACPNAINARCTYATNVINLQARKRDRPRERERERDRAAAFCGMLQLSKLCWIIHGIKTSCLTQRSCHNCHGDFKTSEQAMLKAGSTNCVTLHA